MIVIQTRNLPDIEVLTIDRDSKIMVMKDLDAGNISVTNSIGRAIVELAHELNFDPLEYKVVYRDSMGSWDIVSFPSYDQRQDRYKVEFQHGGKTREEAIAKCRTKL